MLHDHATLCRGYNLRRTCVYIVSKVHADEVIMIILSHRILSILRREELVVTNNEEESFLYLGCKIKLPPYVVSFPRSSLLPPRNPILQLLSLLSLYHSLPFSFSRANSHTFLQPLTELSLWKHYVRALDHYSNPTPKLRTRWWGKSNVPRENNSFGILMSFHLKISRSAKNFDRKPQGEIHEYWTRGIKVTLHTHKILSYSEVRHIFCAKEKF